jgi:hypothetical protein
MRNERLEQEMVWAALQVLADKIKQQDIELKKIKDFLEKL